LHSSTQSSPFETCFGYLPKSPLDFIFGKDVDSYEHRDEDKAQKFIQKIQMVHQAVQEKLEKSQAQYKARHKKHQMDHHFQVGDRVWLHINKDRLKGEGKKLKPIRYGPFTILEKIGTNAFRLDIPPYMQMYSVVNVENLKLYEPPMIMDQMRVFKFLPLMIFLLSTWTSCEKMSFWTGRRGLHEEVMWSTFTWALRECIQAKHDG
jgi:hypothetical protein